MSSVIWSRREQRGVMARAAVCGPFLQQQVHFRSSFQKRIIDNTRIWVTESILGPPEAQRSFYLFFFILWSSESALIVCSTGNHSFLLHPKIRRGWLSVAEPDGRSEPLGSEMSEDLTQMISCCPEPRFLIYLLRPCIKKNKKQIRNKCQKHKVNK